MAVERPTGVESDTQVNNSAAGKGVTSLESILADRKMFPPVEALSAIQNETHFNELDRTQRIRADIIGLIRFIPANLEKHLPERSEKYLEKLEREVQRSGKSEASSYGLGEIDGRKVAVYAMNYDFFNGSLGVVGGEKFQRAADLAIKEEVPFVGIYSSSGARQQESTPGLYQLTRINHAIAKFLRRVRQPYISVLNGQVWGGISASAASVGDLKIAFKGGNYGFSGPRVIKTYQREEEGFDANTQSVEAHAIERNIDVLVENPDELMEFLESYLDVTSSKHEKLTLESLPAFSTPKNGDTKAEALKLHGFLPSDKVFYEVHDGSSEQLSEDASEEDRLYKQYEVLKWSAERPDTQAIISRVFSNVVNLYNGRVEHAVTRHEGNNVPVQTDVLRYPAIIASIGKIGTQPFLIIGDQPSYQRRGDQVVRTPASPRPQDYDYMLRMLEFGKRLKLPVVFLTDTLGANPTLESEKAGQSERISRSILASIEYPYPAMSIIVGALGSGGGLATTPVGDYTAILENGMAFVAEPYSQTSILNNDANPSKEQVKYYLRQMKSTAQDQLRMGFVDEIIQEGENPHIMARNIYYGLAKSFIELQKHSAGRRMAKRDRKIRSLRAFKIIQEEKQTPQV
jgi:acyl-CoA carboxylase subunit beta